MDNYINDNSTVRITNGVIDSIESSRPNTLITVSYNSRTEGRDRRQTIRLVAGNNTIIIDERGNEIPARDLRVGMTINAVASSAMTRSIPPQSKAFVIHVIRRANRPDEPNRPNRPNPPFPGPSLPPGTPRPPFPGPQNPGRPNPERPPVPPNSGRPNPERPPVLETTTGRILDINRQNRSFTTISDGNLSSIISFNVPDSTIIVGRNGIPINFSMLIPGLRVRVRHANFMTASIPPQTTAFEVRVM